MEKSSVWLIVRNRSASLLIVFCVGPLLLFTIGAEVLESSLTKSNPPVLTRSLHRNTLMPIFTAPQRAGAAKLLNMGSQCSMFCTAAGKSKPLRKPFKPWAEALQVGFVH